MAFPRHPISDVTPIDAARGAAQTAGAAARAAAEAFTPPTFGKQKQAVDNEPLHTTFVDGFGVPMLILPGPGVLTIGAGAAIAAGGVKKMRNGK